MDASLRQPGVCPHCGQRMLMRHGVALTPLIADLFDMIERAGEHGVICEVLAGVFYPGKSRRAAEDCIKSNIWHLNSRLVSTDIEVRAGSNGGHEPAPYRVMKREPKKRGRRGRNKIRAMPMEVFR
jgi:hypothetical protein